MTSCELKPAAHVRDSILTCLATEGQNIGRLHHLLPTFLRPTGGELRGVREIPQRLLHRYGETGIPS